MRAVTLICVGKLKEPYYRAACAEYEKRLGGSCRLAVAELPEERLPDSPSAAQISAALEKEGAAILAKLPKSAAVAALCVEGKPLSSEAFSRQLDRWALAGRSGLALIIGGSYGLSPAVKTRADLRLSMSPMTFPHHLARVMALEQLYRAFQIQDGSRYHK